MAQDIGPADAARHYYDPHDLTRFQEIGANAPELAKKFFDWYGAVFADGALSAREKSLIALAVAHVVQCPYCIDAYSKDALTKGADLDQMTEAVHVAAAIRGGASLVHGVQIRWSRATRRSPRPRRNTRRWRAWRWRASSRTRCGPRAPGR
jgi:alkylhydroperoxidase/carboxymuconolactone decarboxylase family protein